MMVVTTYNQQICWMILFTRQPFVKLVVLMPISSVVGGLGGRQILSD